MLFEVDTLVDWLAPGTTTVGPRPFGLPHTSALVPTLSQIIMGCLSKVHAFSYNCMLLGLLQLGDTAGASRSYERAVKLAGAAAPGVYRLMAQLARRCAAAQLGPAGIDIAELEAGLPPLEALSKERVDALEGAAAGACLGVGKSPSASAMGFTRTPSAKYVTASPSTHVSALSCLWGLAHASCGQGATLCSLPCLCTTTPLRDRILCTQAARRHGEEQRRRRRRPRRRQLPGAPSQTALRWRRRAARRSASGGCACPRAWTRPTLGRRPTPSAGCPSGSAATTARSAVAAARTRRVYLTLPSVTTPSVSVLRRFPCVLVVFNWDAVPCRSSMGVCRVGCSRCTQRIALSFSARN